MKRRASVFFIVLISAGCGGTGNSTPVISRGTVPNVIDVTLSNSGLCSGAPNIPCVQVTVCQPGTHNCQTIPDILVDTGSSGLRIFRSALTVPLLQTTDRQGNPIGECISFADLTADWGPVQVADVVLGNEPGVRVPIQVIDSTFGGTSAASSACGSGVKVYSNPTQAFSNGILGINFYQIDGGPYFSCVSATCTPISGLPLNPVQNPVFLLPADYNGIILIFPSVPASGAPSLTGSLILGIGTESNNLAGGGVAVYPSVQGSLTTVYNGTSYLNSVIDSGTNGIAIPDFTIPQCMVNGVSDGILCPPSTLSLTASNQRADLTYQPVSFQIANAGNLNAHYVVFNDFGFYSPPPSGFIWGFPFFLGRTVYLGYDGLTSPLGTGPFWAY